MVRNRSNPGYDLNGALLNPEVDCGAMGDFFAPHPSECLYGRAGLTGLLLSLVGPPRGCATLSRCVRERTRACPSVSGHLPAGPTFASRNYLASDRRCGSSIPSMTNVWSTQMVIAPNRFASWGGLRKCLQKWARVPIPGSPMPVAAPAHT